MPSKISLATAMQAEAARIADAVETLETLADAFFDRGYNAGGTDPIIDADVVTLGITAADVGAMVTVAQQLVNFRDNAAVATADYGGTLNRVRADF